MNIEHFFCEYTVSTIIISYSFHMLSDIKINNLITLNFLLLLYNLMSMKHFYVNTFFYNIYFIQFSLFGDIKINKNTLFSLTAIKL